MIKTLRLARLAQRIKEYGLSLSKASIIAALLSLLPITAQAVGNNSDYFINTRGDSPTASAGGLLKGLDMCISTGNCTICELFSVLSNAVNIMIEIAGGVALGMLLWHVFGMVGSRGNAEAVKGAKEGVWRLAIGFFFLLMSYELVILVIRILAGNFSLVAPWKDLVCTRT